MAKENTEQGKNRAKGARVYVSVILILLVGGVIWFAYSSLATSIEPGLLHVEYGLVLLNGNLVTGDHELKEGDTIETRDGIATVFLYESVVVNLERFTKVTVSDLFETHPKLEQEKGSTWNTFTKISGVEEYTINEGNNVASVRATAFGIGEDYILGGEGFTSYLAREETYLVGREKVVEKIGNEIVERLATPEEKARIRANMQRALNELKYLRQKEIDSHRLAINLVMPTITGKVIDVDSRGNVVNERELNDAEIEEYLKDADKGLYNVDEIVAKIPYKGGFVGKIADLTKAIQKLNEEIELYQPVALERSNEQIVALEGVYPANEIPQIRELEKPEPKNDYIEIIDDDPFNRDDVTVRDDDGVIDYRDYYY